MEQTIVGKSIDVTQIKRKIGTATISRMEVSRDAKFDEFLTEFFNLFYTVSMMMRVKGSFKNKTFYFSEELRFDSTNFHSTNDRTSLAFVLNLSRVDNEFLESFRFIALPL